MQRLVASKTSHHRLWRRSDRHRCPLLSQKRSNGQQAFAKPRLLSAPHPKGSLHVDPFLHLAVFRADHSYTVLTPTLLALCFVPILDSVFCGVSSIGPRVVRRGVLSLTAARPTIRNRYSSATPHPDPSFKPSMAHARRPLQLATTSTHLPRSPLHDFLQTHCSKLGTRSLGGP